MCEEFQVESRCRTGMVKSIVWNRSVQNSIVSSEIAHRCNISGHLDHRYMHSLQGH